MAYEDMPCGVYALSRRRITIRSIVKLGALLTSPSRERPGFSLASADGPGPSGPGIDDTSIMCAEGLLGRSHGGSYPAGAGSRGDLLWMRPVRFIPGAEPGKAGRRAGKRGACRFRTSEEHQTCERR